MSTGVIAWLVAYFIGIGILAGVTIVLAFQRMRGAWRWRRG